MRFELIALTRYWIISLAGSGKTVMILALIMATQDQLPILDSLSLHEEILTPIALRHFPSAEFRGARDNFHRDFDVPVYTVPTLSQIMLHRIRAAPTGIQGSATEAALHCSPHLLKSLQENVPFYLSHADSITGKGDQDHRQTRSRTQIFGPRTIYLSKATLIAVPGNIVAQWKGEIDKHCHSVRLLVLRSCDALPPVKSLASDYDVRRSIF